MRLTLIAWWVLLCSMNPSPLIWLLHLWCELDYSRFMFTNLLHGTTGKHILLHLCQLLSLIVLSSQNHKVRLEQSWSFLKDSEVLGTGIGVCTTNLELSVIIPILWMRKLRHSESGCVILLMFSLPSIPCAEFFPSSSAVKLIVSGTTWHTSFCSLISPDYIINLNKTWLIIWETN